MPEFLLPPQPTWAKTKKEEKARQIRQKRDDKECPRPCILDEVYGPKYPSVPPVPFEVELEETQENICQNKTKNKSKIKKGRSGPITYNPVTDPVFKDIPITSADDVVFIHDDYTLETIFVSKEDKEGPRRSAQSRFSSVSTPNFDDEDEDDDWIRERTKGLEAAKKDAHKNVAERELRKRIMFQLKNEMKVLDEMRKLRRDERMADLDWTWALGKKVGVPRQKMQTEWSGIEFARRLASEKDQEAKRLQSTESGTRTSGRPYRTFDPNKVFHVSCATHKPDESSFYEGVKNSIQWAKDVKGWGWGRASS